MALTAAWASEAVLPHMIGAGDPQRPHAEGLPRLPDTIQYIMYPGAVAVSATTPT